VPITTKVVSLNPAHVEAYSIQHYVIMFVSDMRQVGGFLWLSPPIKLTATESSYTMLLLWSQWANNTNIGMVLVFSTLSNLSDSPDSCSKSKMARSCRGILDTTLCDYVCQWHATGRWFSLAFSTNKTDSHDTTEILLKVALNIITLLSL
jgi:hypothetical protein